MLRPLLCAAVLLLASLLPALPAHAAEDEAGSTETAEDEAPRPHPGPLPVERWGIGTSIGVGAFGYDPAPRLGPRVHLPSLEVALPLPNLQGHLRLRTQLLQTLIHAVGRRIFHLEVDATVVFVGGCDCPLGNHVIRPIFGPMGGLRVSARPTSGLVGGAAGLRAGFEYLAPRRRFGLTLALEPVLEAWGGATGVGSSTFLLGGGALFVVGITGYARQPGDSK